MKKIFLKKVTLICLSTIAISSCIKSEIDDKYEILSNCASLDTSNFICGFELIQKTVQLDTNILGKTSEKTIKYKRLGNLLADENEGLSWSCTGNDFSTSQQVSSANLPPCQGDNCSVVSNPTACNFPKGIVADVSVIGADVNVSKNVSHSNAVTTQYTMPIGNPKGFDDKGRDSDQSGIVWTLTDSDITFTCPTGYAIPKGAPIAQPGKRVEGTRSSSSKLDGWRVEITTTGGAQRVVSRTITDNKWVVNNISGFGSGQDTPNGGFIAFSCVNDSQTDGYTY